jgi:hypothetical protein
MNVTPPGDTHGVTTQLLLLKGGTPNRLDARTRRVGRQGIAEARRRLAEVQPPEPKKLLVAS